MTKLAMGNIFECCLPNRKIICAKKISAPLLPSQKLLSTLIKIKDRVSYFKPMSVEVFRLGNTSFFSINHFFKRIKKQL